MFNSEAFMEVARAGTPHVTKDEMVQRAIALQPLLRERAAETEALGRLPDDTVYALVEAGLLRINTPDCYGGVGLEVDTAAEVAVELARACGSTGWCYAVWSTHTYWVGQWPLEAQAQFFSG